MKLSEWGRILECLFEKHKFVRRFLVGWAATIITLATYAIFKSPETITAASATALATVTGVLTAVISFYQYDRNKDGEGK